MTMISDLSCDLEEEILSRVSLTSLGAVRFTCKRWRALCKDPNFTKKHRGAPLNMTYDKRDGTLKLSLLNIKDLPSIKKIAKIHCPTKLWTVYVCDGLLLCVDTNYDLVLWNPYLAQTKYIFEAFYLKFTYVLGYDNNNTTKVLRIYYGDETIPVVKLEMYDLKYESWRVLDITPNSIRGWALSASLKGNIYFVKRKHWERFEEDCVVCFDFTTERLRPLLPLPFNAATEDYVEISCIRGEQLALLFQRCQVTYETEFWITTNIEHNAVSWTKLFKVDMKSLVGSGFPFDVHRFFVDKEKKVAVVCMISGPIASYVVGEDENYKELDHRQVFYYTPSHVCLY